MPELIALLPYEKAIEAKEGSLTIVAILEGIELVAPVGETIAEDSYVAQNWQVVMMWRRLESDDPQAAYYQRIVLKCDGRSFIEHEFALDLSKPLSRNIFNFGAVPVVEGGVLLITAECRTGCEDWQYAASYPITLKTSRPLADQSS